jgi:tRNA(fMet)-specific endonuclease VapC
MGEQDSRAGMETFITIDTDILIDHFRGVKLATDYIQSIPLEKRSTTDVKVMELLRGASNRNEISLIERFLTRNGFTRLPITTIASRRAVELISKYSPSHGLSISDAIIAAIVLEFRTSLVTRNVRHYHFINDLTMVEAPYRL